MSKRIWAGLLCIVFSLMFFDNLISQENQQERPRRQRPRREGPPVGSVVKDFELKTVEGKTFRLSDFKGKKNIVIELGACT